MMFIKRNLRAVLIFLLNHVLAGTHFFRMKRVIMGWAGIGCGPETKIVGPLRVSKCSEISFGADCWIGAGFTVCGDGVFSCGDNCDFAPEVMIVTGSHEVGGAGRRAGAGKNLEVHVGSGCWLGARSMVIGTVHVSSGTILAAGAVVNKQFEENCILGGIPGRVIRRL